MSLAEDIKQKALELGFDLAGITDTSPIDAEDVELFNDWLKSGCAAQMSYMHRNFEKRINPAKLLQNAKSVICLALNYKPPQSNLKAQDKTVPTGKVATYAQYEDYHLFIKKQLRKLTDFISSIAPTSCKFKICVDSAPLAERALAARAGLGFIGKNHILTNPELGPQLLLGEIITDLKFPPDEPLSCHSERSSCHSERSSCHSERSEESLPRHSKSASADEESIKSIPIKCSDCNKCIAACPTGALRADGRFDANKCISYLTIEYTGRIPAELADKIGARLFGCDECLLACPYQKDAPVCKNKQFKFYPDRAELNLQGILNLNPQDFDTKFADSPIKRLALDTLKRNAQICLSCLPRTK
jgi:epoxyqueuosine reductase